MKKVNAVGFVDVAEPLGTTAKDFRNKYKQGRKHISIYQKIFNNFLGNITTKSS